jgi:cephalosporin hydroxylase
MREAEYQTRFGNISRLTPGAGYAYLSQRERISLYSMVYGLAPAYCLEIGTLMGGSAFIISGALDDIGLDGQLLCIEPIVERIVPEVLRATAHNTTVTRGFFPSDIPAQFRGKSTERLFEFCFYDGDHTYEGVRDHLIALPRWMAPGAFVLSHDGYNEFQARGMREAVRDAGYIDCGMITRCKNDIADKDQAYGGMRLFRVPGELPPNS